MPKLANIIVPVILFILLSPGFLITLPPIFPSVVEKVSTSTDPYSQDSIFYSNQTSKQAVVEHAIVFIIIYALLRHYFKSAYTA